MPVTPAQLAALLASHALESGILSDLAEAWDLSEADCHAAAEALVAAEAEFVTATLGY